MKITENADQNEATVALQGKLDTVTSNNLQDKINELIDGDISRVWIDCGQLEYLSSTGLRVFLQTQKRLRGEKKAMALCGLKPHIKEIFDIAGLSHVFSFCTNIDTARETVKAGA